MSPVVIVFVVAGVVVMALLALGAGLMVALRSTADAVVALEERLADIEDKSAQMRATLAAVDDDLATMVGHLAVDSPQDTVSRDRVDPSAALPTRGPRP